MIFCQKCGNQLQERTAFCSSCGTQQGSVIAPTMSVTNQALSIQDFLAISPDYQAKKEECEKKKKINKAVFITPFIIGMILMLVLIFVNFIFSLLCFVIGFICGFISMSREQKFNKQLEKDGEELYRQYMNNK